MAGGADQRGEILPARNSGRNPPAGGRSPRNGGVEPGRGAASGHPGPPFRRASSPRSSNEHPPVKTRQNEYSSEIDENRSVLTVPTGTALLCFRRYDTTRATSPKSPALSEVTDSVLVFVEPLSITTL